MATTSEKTLPLFEVNAVFATPDRRTQYISCGAIWKSEKGCVLTMNGKPVGDTGDWDMKTFIGFPVTGNEKQATAFIEQAVKSDNGKKLPLVTLKAIFGTPDRRTQYVECGRVFTSNEGRVVVTIDAEPYGDSGDWDGRSYVGVLTDKRAKSGKAKSNDEPETA